MLFPSCSSVSNMFKTFLAVLMVLPFLKANQCFRKRLFLQIAKGDSLTTNVISSHDVESSMDCGHQCLLQATCVAFNYRSTRKSGEPNCQLTNSTEGFEGNGAKNNVGDWTFHKALMDTPPCLKNPCKNGGEWVQEDVCQPESFSCKCGFKYKGQFCETKEVFKSCKEALDICSVAQDGIYKIETATAAGFTKVYCQMTSLSGCSGGGWTMVMKIDGKKETFKYSSPYWSDKQSYNLAGGMTAFDNEETKLPTYWSTSFKELCVGMEVGDALKFVSIDYPASSLYSLIADGQYRLTGIGRQKWKSLISGSSLQYNCNKEGFNLQLQISVRLGILGNNEQHCSSVNSFIGFGVKKITSLVCKQIPNPVNIVGNLALCRPDNGDKNIIAKGFMLVR